MSADSNRAENFAMTELAEQLNGPNGSSIAASILARLTRLADELENQKRSGLSPNDYSQAEIIASAIVAAREIVLGTFSASGTAAH
jgi:hypothetical protein